MRAFLPLLALRGACASAAPQSESMRCRVQRDGGLYQVEARIERGGETICAPRLTLLPDPWGSMFVGEGRERALIPQTAADGTGPVIPTAQAIEAGAWIALRCHDLDDGRIRVDVRAAAVRDGAVQWKIDCTEPIEDGGVLQNP